MSDNTSYDSTMKFWIDKHHKGGYVAKLNSKKLIDRTNKIITKYRSQVSEAKTFCELGVGSGRNVYYFNKEFPYLDCFGNDINLNTYVTFDKVFPDLLKRPNIVIEIIDTLTYLRRMTKKDIIFTYGHLMHLPDDIIEEVCFLINEKSQKNIIFEAFPQINQKDRYLKYRFERDYSKLLRGYQEKTIMTNQCLYYFER